MCRPQQGVHLTLWQACRADFGGASMAKLLSVLVLLLGGIGFLVFGVLLLFQPVETMASIGFIVPPGVPTTEIRAFYGGAELALGSLLLLCAWFPARRWDGLILNGVAYGCVGLSRLYGMVVDGSRSDFLSFALATELGLALLSGVALVLLARARR